MNPISEIDFSREDYRGFVIHKNTFEGLYITHGGRTVQAVFAGRWSMARAVIDDLLERGTVRHIGSSTDGHYIGLLRGFTTFHGECMATQILGPSAMPYPLFEVSTSGAPNVPAIRKRFRAESWDVAEEMAADWAIENQMDTESRCLKRIDC